MLIRKTTDERPLEELACRTFVGLSVTIATLGFWSKGWIPGLLLTVAMAVIVFLLSKSVERIKEARDTGNNITAAVVGVLAAGFGAIEACLNHIGLEKLNVDYALAPAYVIWPTCFFISLVNVFASYAYARQMEDRRKPKLTVIESPATQAGRELAGRRWNRA